MKATTGSFSISCWGALVIVGYLTASTAIAQTTDATSTTPEPAAAHLRLVDRLDRPQDGYCFDILGTPGYLRPDLPLFAHNCKPRLTSDSAVVFDSQGRIRFAAVNLCVTIAGVNSRALPGASVLVRECGEETPFFEASQLQRFSFEADGRLKLKESELCVTVGAESASTYSPADRWRPLYVADCNTAEPALSRWEFIDPAK